MKAYHEQPGVTIFHGKAEEVLPTFAPARFSTVITDPPYELGFMGKGWDSTGIAFQPSLWAEVLRVCKPGAMLLAFGGTRTFHRLTCAIEDAGWEIRDCMMWLYGSGFPKSLDISKAIDKAAGAEREVVTAMSRSAVRPFVADQSRGKAYRLASDASQTAPATDAARQWSGWGTALKPAWEPIIVAMKPLDGTFAENAQRHGVAGLNIDGGRIESGPNDYDHPGNTTEHSDTSKVYGWAKSQGKFKQSPPHTAGRWPANVLLDEAAAAQLDGMSGERIAGRFPEKLSQSKFYGQCRPGTQEERTLDSGGASRFFYTAKASKGDRGYGNDHATVKPTALLDYLCKLTATPAGGEILDPFGGSMTTPVSARKFGRPCVAIEMVEDHCRIGVSRLAQFPLFAPAALEESA